MSFCFKNQRDNWWYLLCQILFFFCLLLLYFYYCPSPSLLFNFQSTERIIQEREGLCDTAPSVFLFNYFFFCVTPYFVFLHKKQNQPPYFFYFFTPFLVKADQKRMAVQTAPFYFFLSPLCFVSANKTQQQTRNFSFYSTISSSAGSSFFVDLQAANTHEEAIQLP